MEMLGKRKRKRVPSWGALQRGLGGPWPTQNFGWVGHNAFGPTNNWPMFVSKISLKGKYS